VAVEKVVTAIAAAHCASNNEIMFPPSSEPRLPAEQPAHFDDASTTQFQVKMKKAPVWFCSMLAGNTREKRRLGDELAAMKGAWTLLMKQRHGGGKWSRADKERLRQMLRSASSVSPYLFIWAIPGSVILLPFLAWYLDKRHKAKGAREANDLPSPPPGDQHQRAKQ
jgi:hypothetical protein